MQSGTIYKITNLINNKIYIGKTTRDIKRRFIEHKLKAKSGLDYHLSRAIRKYGDKNFIIETIQVFCCTSESLLNRKLDEAEKKYINLFNSKINGYNMTDGGDGGFGHIITEETRKRLSEAKRGEKNPNYGKHTSNYCRSGEFHPLYGKSRSEECKQAMKEAWKTRPNPKYKYILRYSLDGKLIKKYSRIRELEDEFTRSGVYNALRGIIPTYKKYIWKYEL